MESKTGIKEIQKELLKMITELDSFFTEYNISYFVTDGTLLGMKRHRGFIPWDDDIDVGMTRDNFNKFIELRDKLPEPLKLRFWSLPETDEKYIYNYGKVENSKTLLIEDTIQHLNIQSGIYLDIFIYDGVPRGYMKRHFHHFHLMYLNIIKSLLIMDPNIQRNLIKQLLINMTHDLFRLKKIQRKIDSLITKYKLENCDYACNYSEIYLKMNKLIKKDILLKGKRQPFENTYLQAMGNVDAYLKIMYGDYMQLPPKEEQISHHKITIKYINNEE